MNFRTRVISATLLAAAIAVILACSASYFTTRNSLLRAVDESLSQLSQLNGPGAGPHDEDSTNFGAFTEIVLANGKTYPTSRVPIDATIKKIAASTSSQRVIRTVTISNEKFRELIVPVTLGTNFPCDTGICETATPAAELYIVNITGQLAELHRLISTLLVVAAGGLLLALGLGLILARNALHPLELVTNDIERVANSANFSSRIEVGGSDELGRLRRVFNRLLSNVEDSQTLQRQLVLDASHELRTPLTSLRTNAQVMARAKELDASDVSQISQDMIAQVDELAALVTDLGELARGERSEGAVITLALDELVEESVETARTHARTKNIEIDVDISPSNVQGRRDRLARAINNLLTNAIKFTPEGGRISVRTSAGCIEVGDSGPGIAEAERPFVFDRFWRSPQARALPGSGLGLAIVAQVVSEMNGEVEITTDPVLGGAHFSIRIPEAAPQP